MVYIKEKWEPELNVIIEDNEWEELCKQGHKGHQSQLWKEFDWIKTSILTHPL